MSKMVWVSAAVVTALAGVGKAVADGVGKFATEVPETKLFLENGRILGSDLSFGLPNGESVRAPKGSTVNQLIPPVIWQFSGLLPASDYLKTIAIHSVSTDEKSRSWQHVQNFFYDGLRAEGANDVEAKVAFAGAYAFAPRWPLVKFTEVVEDENIKLDSVLYDVNYIQPPLKGFSLESYRSLALQIVNKPDDLSLQDIRSVIDAADEARSSAAEKASLGGIGGELVTGTIPDFDTKGSDINSKASDVAATKPDTTGIRTAGNTQLLFADQRKVSKSSDDIEVVADAVPAGELADVEIPIVGTKNIDTNSKAPAQEYVATTEKPDTTGIRTAANTRLLFAGQRKVNKLSDDLAVITDAAKSNITDDQVASTAADSTGENESTSPITALFYDDLENGEVVDANDQQRSKKADSMINKEVETVTNTPLPVSDLFVDDDSANPQVIDDGEKSNGVVALEIALDSEKTAKPAIKEPSTIDSLFPVDDEFSLSDEALAEQQVPDDEWVMLPNGTTVLRNVEKLVSQ